MKLNFVKKLSQAKYGTLLLALTGVGALGLQNVANVTAAGTTGGAISGIYTTWIPVAMFAVALYCMAQVVTLKVGQKPFIGYATVSIFALAIGSALITNATGVLTSVPIL